MARRRKMIETEVESSFELDLAPMLALMVTLIPIMLLSTVFVRVTVIETPLPQVVQKAMEEDRNKKDRQISVSLTMASNKSFRLKVTENGRVKKNLRLPRKSNEWDFQRLHKGLVEVKQMYPRTFRLDLIPHTGVPYKEIVKVMDAARHTTQEDPKLYIMDTETKKKVETDVMFPNVVFSNLVEG